MTNSTEASSLEAPAAQNARREVTRWAVWFLPPTALLAVVLYLGLDRSFVAVCLWAYPMLTIRLVRAWGDYQDACDASNGTGPVRPVAR